jgi:hypothetical protein
MFFRKLIYGIVCITYWTTLLYLLFTYPIIMISIWLIGGVILTCVWFYLIEYKLWT